MPTKLCLTYCVLVKQRARVDAYLCGRPHSSLSSSRWGVTSFHTYLSTFPLSCSSFSCFSRLTHSRGNRISSSSGLTGLSASNSYVRECICLTVVFFCFPLPSSLFLLLLVKFLLCSVLIVAGGWKKKEGGKQRSCNGRLKKWRKQTNRGRNSVGTVFFGILLPTVFVGRIKKRPPRRMERVLILINRLFKLRVQQLLNAPSVA